MLSVEKDKEAERSGNSHDHFMTETLGGDELSNELQGAKKSHALTNHLIIYGWNDTSES